MRFERRWQDVRREKYDSVLTEVIRCLTRLLEDDYNILPGK